MSAVEEWVRFTQMREALRVALSRYSKEVQDRLREVAELRFQDPNMGRCRNCGDDLDDNGLDAFCTMDCEYA